MSFPDLRDLFIGSVGADYCVKALLFLKSPSNVKEYLIGIHKVTFPKGDISKTERWRAYPRIKRSPKVIPIMQRDLLDSKFMEKQADKLSFDISRFMEFFDGYAKVGDDIKPIMLHYSMIYLFDFFSRTWLKYARNWGHGMKIHSWKRSTDAHGQFSAKIQKSGIFHRAVDAFYFLKQSSLFSIDDDDGIPYQHDFKLEVPFEKIEKMKYSEYPEINLTRLINIYDRIGKIDKFVSKSNPILVGYVILFITSSISRYRAKDWFKIRENRDLKNKFDLLQYDFLYKWIHEILMQTILRRGLKKELSISSE